MAFKFLLLAAFLAVASASHLEGYAGHLGYEGQLGYAGHLGYAGNLGYEGHLGYGSNLGYSSYAHSAPLLNYAAPATLRTVAHEPLVSQYSTYSAPAISKTIYQQPAPIVSRTYSAPVVTRVAAPVAYAAPIVKTISHEPSGFEYSTFVKTAPAITKTRITPQAPIVTERVSHPAPIVTERLVTPVVKQVVAPVQYSAPWAAPAQTYGPPAW